MGENSLGSILVATSSTSKLYINNQLKSIGSLEGCNGINRNYTNNCNC
jgi:hypothetical protein